MNASSISFHLIYYIALHTTRHSMEGGALDNPNPTVKARSTYEVNTSDALPARVFNVIRDIRDPEHPHTLEELSVVTPESVTIIGPNSTKGYGRVSVEFIPTVPHCSLASVIGLSIMQKLRESNILDKKEEAEYYKLSVSCGKDAHTQAEDINRQLADKERVSAALENPRIAGILRSCVDNLPG